MLDSIAGTPDDGRQKPNYSRARRRHAVALIRGAGILTDQRLNDDDRLVYVVGILVATDTGYISAPVLHAACTDPSVLQAARELLRKAAA